MEPEELGATPESAVSAALEAELRRLGRRCAWYKQVGMLCWTHSLKPHADRLRIDYVVQLDNASPLLGIEVKAVPQAPRDLGRALFQAAQYAAGYIAPAPIGTIPPTWVGKPLTAVFLWLPWEEMRTSVHAHAKAAHRLYGPANVGFAFHADGRLQFRLCAERFWCANYGFHRGAISFNKTNRSGNGNFRATGETVL